MPRAFQPSGFQPGAFQGLPSPPPTDLRRWSSLQTWQELGLSGFPTSTDFINIPSIHPGILYDVDSGEVLDFTCHSTFEVDPFKDTRLNVHRNFVMHHGILRIRTPSIFEMVWPAVDENQFVGGGHDVLATDPGLWIMSAAVDIVGATVKPWTTAVGSLAKDALLIMVTEDPLGWEVGQEIAIAPTLPPNTLGAFDSRAAYDIGRIQAISGRAVTLENPLLFDHPALVLDGQTIATAEVLYLDRRIRFMGAPEKRAHVMMMAHDAMMPMPVLVEYVMSRWMGPQKNGQGVLGRYAWMHLHEMGDISRGAQFTGGLARDCGNHCFVPHASHGTTWTDCVSHDTYLEPYWRDRSGGVGTGDPDPAMRTHDTLIDRCVASLVRPLTGQAVQLAGFFTTTGQRNKMIDCRVFGVLGGKESPGLLWPEGESHDGNDTGMEDEDGNWEVQGLISHNNEHGTSSWQNTQNCHVVMQRSLIYRNRLTGIKHGAYDNSYVYTGTSEDQPDLIVMENGKQQLRLHAVSRVRSGLQTYQYMTCAGPTDYLVTEDEHARGPEGPTVFRDVTFRNITHVPNSAIFLLGPRTVQPSDVPMPIWWDVIDCPGTETLNLAWVGPLATSLDQLRVQGLGFPEPLRLMKALVPGQANPGDDYFEPAWNASVKRIAPF